MCKSCTLPIAFRSLWPNTCDYVGQLEEVRRLVSTALGHNNNVLVYQSRSGAPGQPWLEPDILDYLREVKAQNLASAVVLAPISFISDHMEVLYDLDVEARQLCDSLGLPMVRAETAGVHPKFIAMIRELILERMNSNSGKKTHGSTGRSPGYLRGRLLSGAASPVAATSISITGTPVTSSVRLRRSLHSVSVPPA